LDNDDLALPDRLTEQVQFMRKSPGVTLLGTCAIEIDEHGAIIKSHDYPTNSALLNNLRRAKRFFPHSSAMFRSDVVKSIGGYNSRFRIAQDHDLWLRLSEKGQIACLKKCLVKIRNHSRSASTIDEGTKKSIFEGIAANVCYLLRSKGVADPSACDNAEDWRIFMEWIALRTEQEGFSNRLQQWSQIRDDYLSESDKLSGALRMGMAIATSGHSIRMIYEKLHGSDLRIKLAEEWNKRGICSGAE
jgi:hypothetical protein